MEDIYMPEEQVEEIREAFTMFDEDNDGVISIPEFVSTMKSLGNSPSQLEIDEMMKTIDANGDGMIDFDEFKHLMYTRMRTPDEPEDIKDLFMVLDMDRNGFFTAAELHRVIHGLGESVTMEEARDLVDSAPSKERGKINYEEFCQLVWTLLTTPQFT